MRPNAPNVICDGPIDYGTALDTSHPIGYIGVMSLSKKTRFEVFKRGLFTCQYCGRRPPDVVLEVDHIIAKANGGSDEMDNLTTSCFDCNRGKSARALGETLPAVHEMQRLEAIQEMAERATMLKKQTDSARVLRQYENEVASQAEEWWQEIIGDDTYLVYESLLKFVRRLPPERIMEAIQSTKSRFNKPHPYNQWKYFCGTCWKMIRADSKGD